MMPPMNCKLVWDPLTNYRYIYHKTLSINQLSYHLGDPPSGPATGIERVSEVRGFPTLDGDGMGMGQYLQHILYATIKNNLL